MPSKSSSLADTKLVRILAGISAREMLQLEKFVHSPIYCSNKEVIHLFDLLKKEHPRFSPKALEKEKIATVLFTQYKKKKFDPQRELTLICTYLRDLIYSYFQWKELQFFPYLNKWLLLHALHNRGIYEDEELYYTKFQKEISSILIPSARNYLDFYLISDFDLIRKKDPYATRDIHSILRYLDAFYLNDKLKRMCLAVQVEQQELLNTYQLSATFAYVENIEKPPLLTRIYYHLLKALVSLSQKAFTEAEQHYFSIKDLRTELITLIPKDEKAYAPVKDDLMDIYQFSIFIAKRLGRGINMDYRNELFLIYDEQLNFKLFQENGFLHHQHYKNIITVFLRLKEFEKAKLLMEKYHPQIHPKFREDSYAYNRAHLALLKNAYQEVHKVLYQMNFINPNYKVGAYILRLKAYYLATDEASNDKYEYYEEFIRIRLDAYRYLKRNKQLPSMEREEYLKFIAFVWDLMKIKMEDKGSLQKLKSEIESNQSVFDKEWLLMASNGF